uniref:Uncharacterized protein n=1 Tax=Glossina brevipalpis TaxID=37001 RepID=A0A1A9WU77_9MUSC
MVKQDGGSTVTTEYYHLIMELSAYLSYLVVSLDDVDADADHDVLVCLLLTLLFVTSIRLVVGTFDVFDVVAPLLLLLLQQSSIYRLRNNQWVIVVGGGNNHVDHDGDDATFDDHLYTIYKYFVFFVIFDVFFCSFRNDQRPERLCTIEIATTTTTTITTTATTSITSTTITISSTAAPIPYKDSDVEGAEVAFFKLAIFEEYLVVFFLLALNRFFSRFVCKTLRSNSCKFSMVGSSPCKLETLNANHCSTNSEASSTLYMTQSSTAMY